MKETNTWMPTVCQYFKYILLFNSYTSLCTTHLFDIFVHNLTDLTNGSVKWRNSPMITPAGKCGICSIQRGSLITVCSPSFQYRTQSFLAVITEVLVPSEETWAGPTTLEQWKILLISAIESTSFKLPFMGRKEDKGSLILPLFTYKGFCFALLFVPLILIALNIKICTRSHWVFNIDFWCSKLKPWFLCLWEPLSCLQNALSIILKTLGWRNDHNFPHIQTSS